MGKWLRDAKEDAAMLRSVFEAAQAGNVFEPIAWITAAIKTRAQQAAPFEPTDDHGWRKRFKVYEESHAWPAVWGGTHPGDDPRHPPHILKEFGLEKAA